MKFLEFISAVNIFEAAKDRYTQMFTNLEPLFDNIESDVQRKSQSDFYKKEVNEQIDWAMNTLKKQDKVIWYLRLFKVDLLTKLAATPDGWKTFGPAFEKAGAQLAKKMGIADKEAMQHAQFATSAQFKRHMQHFLSYGFAAFNEYVFVNQTPLEIISDWTPIEEKWQERRKHTVPLDREGVDTIIEYPDGSEWVNLNKEYCDAEGLAMGHCGNAADPKEGDTVLSYRTIEEEDGEQLWKPQLTFVLDKNGLLGETKARFNEPPNEEEHHAVIVDLLRQDFVKGIKGGGHEPENNFHFEDLSEELQEELAEEKPGLASIGFDYKKRGMTKELLARMEGMWAETGQTHVPEYDDDSGMFWQDSSYSLYDFLDRYGGDQAVWVSKILDGREHLDIDLGGHAYYQDELFDGLSTEVQHRVGKWVIENHESEVEEWKEENDTHYDGTDASDTMKIVKEYEIEEVTDALYRAEMTGHEYGAEKEMQDDLSSWLKELPNNMDWDLSVSPDTTWEDDDDGTRKLGFPVEVMIDVLDNYTDEVANQGGIAEVAEIKELEAPYNGWQGFDEEGAKERAEEELYETGVLTNETP